MNIVSGGLIAGNLIFASGNVSETITFRPEFVPNELPNLLSWYSSDYGVYNSPGVLATNGQTVRTWENKINNGVNLNQTSNINYQPVYLNNAVQFTGYNSITGVNPVALNYPLNYYIATQTILSGSDSTWPAVIIKQGSNTTLTQNKYVFTVNTGSKIGVRDLNTLTTSNITMSNDKNIIYSIFSGSNTQILGKGLSSEILNATTNINSNTVFIIGSLNSTLPVYPLFGSIYEILIYTGSAHTESERNKIINYLSNKWGVNI